MTGWGREREREGGGGVETDRQRDRQADRDTKKDTARFRSTHLYTPLDLLAHNINNDTNHLSRIRSKSQSTLLLLSSRVSCVNKACLPTTERRGTHIIVLLQLLSR